MTLRYSCNKLRWFSSAILLCVALVGGRAYAATSLTQFGITWTFDRDYTTGQFANGDHWVVGPVKITSISPRSVVSGGATMHGSMTNPAPGADQGYDSRIKNNPYVSAANVARAFPFTVQPGSSLLSSESYTEKAVNNGPQLKTIAILTVLGSAAPAGTFRPPYMGTDKPLRWNKSQLQYSKLRSLPVVANAPALASVEKNFERPWIEQKTNWTGRFMHPDTNMPDYGREMAHTLGSGLLSLQLNYTNAQKEKLLVRLVQYGIDIYGAAKAGTKWSADGGHNQGRKMPLLLAGVMLGDSDIQGYADGTARRIFQEDQQTWYVVQSDVGRTLYTADGRPRDKYIASDVGTPEWGEKHASTPSRDGRNWDTYYRDVSGAPTVGHILTARLMKLEGIWKWAPVFDYYDRFWSIEKKNVGSGANSIPSFVGSMWAAYRSSEPTDFNDDNVATEIWQNTAIMAQSKSFTIAFDTVPSGAAIDGVTGISAAAADDYSDLAAAVRFATTGNIDARNGGVYQALTAFKYTAGVKYRVIMTVNPETKRYSVKVTPPGGSTTTIADNWAFRTEQLSVTQLANVGFHSATGAHSVLNIAVTTTSEPPAPAPAPTPAPSTSTTLFRVNAGGSSFVDGAGKTWSADTSFNTGLKYSTSNAIAGTTDDKLYQTERYDLSDSTELAYAFTVPNGSYEVKLHFAEVYGSTSGTGKRVFDVEIEDEVAFENLDIFAKAGGANRALVMSAPATVADGKLTIRLLHGVQNPKICGIEIIKL